MIDLETCDKLTSRFLSVRQDILEACADTDQNQADVSLLAVSKKHTIDAIKHIYSLGQTAFGENYVQEGIDKVQALSELNIDWHFIGPIQSNKSKAVAEYFDWVHTVDREKIASRLNQQRPIDKSPLNVLIQVNISQQDSKSGVNLNEVATLAKSISQMPNLCLRGLMCIPAEQETGVLKKEFQQMQHAFKQLKGEYPNIDTLSMGMSGDLTAAIECGSTLVRIGTAIFGQRQSQIDK
ncbi:MAG: pyridoxal phosphate enzyme (YggS family) [Psychrobacter glaciei]|jgi:pyridoxal phosphate enzyme (YggS family)